MYQILLGKYVYYGDFLFKWVINQYLFFVLILINIHFYLSIFLPSFLTSQNWAKGPSGKQKQGRLPGQLIGKKKQVEEGKKADMNKQENDLAEMKGEGGEEEEGQEENGVKNLRIDFLHSKMPQAYPCNLTYSFLFPL